MFSASRLAAYQEAADTVDSPWESYAALVASVVSRAVVALVARTHVEGMAGVGQLDGEAEYVG